MIAEGFPYLFFVKNAQFSGKSVFCAAKTRKMCVKCVCDFCKWRCFLL